MFFYHYYLFACLHLSKRPCFINSLIDTFWLGQPYSLPLKISAVFMIPRVFYLSLLSFMYRSVPVWRLCFSFIANASLLNLYVQNGFLMSTCSCCVQDIFWELSELELNKKYTAVRCRYILHLQSQKWQWFQIHYSWLIKPKIVHYCICKMLIWWMQMINSRK